MWIDFYFYLVFVGPVPTPSTSGGGDTVDDERRRQTKLANELDELLLRWDAPQYKAGFLNTYVQS